MIDWHCRFYWNILFVFPERRRFLKAVALWLYHGLRLILVPWVIVVILVLRIRFQQLEPVCHRLTGVD